MNDESALDPAVVAAMRAVPPATDEVRERHIAAALGAIGPSVPARRTGTRQHWFSVAAATVALAGGFALGRVGGGTTDLPRNADLVGGPPTTATVPKTGTGCAATIGNARVLTAYDSDDGPRTIVLTDAEIIVLDATTCETLVTIPLP